VDAVKASRPLLVLVVLAIPLAGALRPLPARAGPPGREPPPVTALESGPLGRADLVVVGEIEEVRPLRGQALVRVRVAKTLKGEAGGDHLTVVVRGPRPSADPQTPSVPFFEATTRGRYAFFLQRGPGGAAWPLDALFLIEGVVGLEKEQSLEAIAGLLRIEDRAERDRALLGHLLDAAGADGLWTRVNAARELAHAAAARPELFDGAARARIERVLAKTTAAEQRAWLTRALAALPPWTSPAEERGEVPRASGRLAALEESLEAAADDATRGRILARALEADPAAAPDVLRALATVPPRARAEAVRLFGEGRLLPAARVRDLYAHEEDPEVQSAIVAAVGRLRDGAEVPWVVARLCNLRLWREACFALARIRTAEALAALRTERERAAQDGETARDRLALLDYLLGPAFAEAESGAGR
jgi:hypothetical protein